MNLIDLLHNLELAVLERRVEKVISVTTAFEDENTIYDQVTELKNITIHLCKGEYLAVLKFPTPQLLLNPDGETADFGQQIREKISLLLHDTGEGDQSYVGQVLVLFTGVACLKFFLQCNWTGPLLQSSGDLSSVLPGYFGQCSKVNLFQPTCRSSCFNLGQVVADTKHSSQKESYDQAAIARLNQDGECLYNSLMDVPLFLVAALVILVENEEKLPMCQLCCLWAMRCLAVQRQLFYESNDTVKDKIFMLMEKVEQREALLSKDKNRFIATQIHLELGHLYLVFYDTTKAREHFEKAKTSVRLSTSLTGALGKRTRFQENNVSQLVLQVTRNEDCVIDSKMEVQFNGTGPNEKTFVQDFPKDVALNDDTLLEKIKFEDTDLQRQNNTALTPLDQAVILGLCVEFQKSQAVHRLNKEELLAYLEVIFTQPRSWCAQIVALLMRSRLEKDSSRRLERSMMQLQALVDSVSSTSPKACDRQFLLHCVPLPPRWAIQRELAKLLFEMGAVKSALEIFQKLHLWEDVATCYQCLGWYAKAENLIREQLALNETPLLWCLLGDTLKDASCYEKAWELSENRSSRAQRSLGYLYLRDKEYAKSIPCFEKSLGRNSLQEGVWFSLGCAAMMTEDFPLSSKAFHRCVSLDNQNSQAWNNLASVYIKRKQKLRAHLALKEALKANYENWQTWENFLVVSVDVGGFNDAINAYHRLMDLREKYCDVEVLSILVRAVNQGILNFQDNPASLVKPKLLKLMGRVTSQITNNAEVWKLYSDLYMASESKEDKEKALHFLIKAHRVRTQAQGWENDVTQFKEVIELTLHLSEVYVEVSQGKEDKTESVQLLSSSKLNLKQLITRAKKLHTDSLTGDMKAELSDGVAELETNLQRIVDLISGLND